MRWTLISVRLIVAIALFGVISCGTLLVALVAFQDLRSGYDDLADSSIPQLVDAARLAQMSQAIASTAPSLATLRSDYVRRSVNQRIADQVRSLDRYLDSLASADILNSEQGTRLLKQIRKSRATLVEDLERLNETVSRRIVVARRLSALLRDARSVATELIAARAETGAAGDGSAARTTQERRSSRIHQALLEALSLPSVDNPAIVRRLQARALDQLKLADIAPGDRGHETDSIHARLASLFSSRAGVFPLKAELIKLTRTQEGLLGKNKASAQKFVSSAAELSHFLRLEMERRSGLYGKTASEKSLLIGAVVILAVTATLGLSLFVRRSVLARLNAVKDGMRAQVRGENRTLRIEGNDEIAEIGRAAQHLVIAITEREKRLRLAKEQAERLAEEADAANRAKSVFLANMSHELRTPLNAIIGFSEIIQSGIVSDEKVKEYAGDINSSGCHLLNLISEILDYSKIEAGQQELQFVEVDVAAILNPLAKLVTFQLDQRNLKLDFDLQGMPVIRADEMAFRQVLLNLLSNAAKFSFEGTTIRVPGERRGDLYAISVRDRGVGIEPDQLELVLQPFHQVNNSFAYSRSTGGTGLGLAITDNLVRLHGGELQMESEMGVGTTVTVTFPLAASCAESLPAPIVMDDRAAMTA